MDSDESNARSLLNRVLNKCFPGGILVGYIFNGCGDVATARLQGSDPRSNWPHRGQEYAVEALGVPPSVATSTVDETGLFTPDLTLEPGCSFPLSFSHPHSLSFPST